MSLHKEDVKASDIVEIFQIKKRFLENSNIDKAYAILLQEIINFFDIDRIYIGMKSVTKNKCIPIVEYVKGREVNFLGDVVDFRKYAKFIDIEINIEEKEYMTLADENNYFTDDRIDTYYNVVNKLGYIKSNLGKVNESLIFYAKGKESFSFMVMERYGNRENKFSLVERLFLENIYNLLKSRVEKETLAERVYNEICIKDKLVDNEHMPVCMVSVADKKIVYFNSNYKLFVPKVQIGLLYDDLFYDNELFKDKSKVELIADSETLVMHKYNVNGEELVTYWIKKVVSATLADGTKVHMIYIKDTADYIRQLEGIDLLTSAYSVKGFSNSFKNLVNEKSKNYSLCIFDVAKFKYINDSKGFEVGNKLLKRISEVLGRFIRSKEIYCRINEDKFAVLFQCDTKDEVKARINSLFIKLENMRAEYFKEITITYVCGVTDVEKGEEINILIDRANMARKSAKGSHKNIISFFDEEIERKLNDETTIETRVANAVENGEFVPYLQPKFNLETMKICGAEALVRWISPMGMIFPDRFIPLFEKNGFITTLDFIVYKKVMEHIRSCLDRGVKVYPISLNVSRNHIQNKNFITNIMELVEEYNIPTDLLELEITESVFVEDREILKLFVGNIRCPKIKVSIDDFGSAYSSLQILKDIDMDILKIDKGFLDNIGSNSEFTKDEIVLKNIINLAKDLKCTVICEGIETKEQIEVLKGIGCELGQGYIFAKPMSIADYEKDFLK